MRILFISQPYRYEQVCRITAIGRLTTMLKYF